MEQYNAAPITSEDEHRRATASKSRSESSGEAQIIVKTGTVLEIDSKGKIATVKLDDEPNSYKVRMKTSLNEIMLLWGDPTLLRNVPCTLYYIFSPPNGFVELGAPEYVKVKDKDRAVSKPFSL